MIKRNLTTLLPLIFGLLVSVAGTIQAATFTVTNTDDDGPGSFREAITDANGAAGADTIVFAVSGTIQPVNALPLITEQLFIDGTTAPGASCPSNLKVVLDGSSLPSTENGLVVFADDCKIQGLVIVNFPGSGLVVDASDDGIFQCNHLGVDTTGLVALPNGEFGLYVLNLSKRNLIGTDGDGVNDADERNIISGNAEDGIRILGNGTNANVISGNYIGTDVTGAAALPNGENGVHIIDGAKQNLVGTDGNGIADAAQFNIISGNGNQGVRIIGNGTNDNTVAGNYIGVDITGAIGLGNTVDGVEISVGARNNTIGTNGDATADPAERNIISDNGNNGVSINGLNTFFNEVAGNYIGTDLTGLVDLGNTFDGVEVSFGANQNLVGTDGDGIADVDERNIISGNGRHGICIFGLEAEGNTVAGNFIGIDVTGMTAMGNTQVGVFIADEAKRNKVGTDGDGIGDAVEGNVISANGQEGVRITDNRSDNNRVAGNYIGLTSDGINPMANGTSGVWITEGPVSNTIGGSLTDERNFICAHPQFGVYLNTPYPDFAAGGPYTERNEIIGNTIGNNVLGAGVANSLDGIYCELGVSNTFESNIIANNGRHGLQNTGSESFVTNNIIEFNGESGIYITFHEGANASVVTEYTAPNDVISSMDIDGNIVQNNCATTAGVCAGIAGWDDAVDGANMDKGTTLGLNNFIITNNGYPDITQWWYGALEWIDSTGTPISLMPQEIISAGSGPTYNLVDTVFGGTALDSTILHGVTGITVSNYYTWTEVNEYIVDETGVLFDYAPHRADSCALYSFDGDATTNSTDDGRGFNGDGIASTLDVAFDSVTAASWTLSRYQVFQSSACNIPPEAVTDSANTFEDIPVIVAVLANDSDVDGGLDTSSLNVTVLPTNGTITIDPVTGVITYTPDPDFYGSDSFIYEICDIQSPTACDTAVVYITIDAVNDPPVLTADIDSMIEDAGSILIDILGNDSDASDPFGSVDPTTVSIPIPPANGSVTVNPLTGFVTYTPDANFNGTDTFTYRVCDDGFPMPPECSTEIVTIVVEPVNDPPQVEDDALGAAATGATPLDVLANDTDSLDPLGGIDPATVTILTPPFDGSVSVDPVSGIVTYTASGTFSAVDSFEYQVCDLGNPLPAICGTAWVLVDVGALPPNAMDDSITTPEEVAVLIDVLANDADLDGTIDSSSLAIFSTPANGTVSVDPVTHTITYTPAMDFFGLDQFDYEICDTDGNCATARVFVTVLPIDDIIIANNDAYITLEDVPIVMGVTANDTDVDGDIDLASLNILTVPSNGSTVFGPIAGTIIYTPNLNFNGFDSLRYRVCDLATVPNCSEAWTQIEVIDVNDGPYADEDYIFTDVGVAVTIDAIANDGDYEPDGFLIPNTMTIVAPPAHGVAFASPTGQITYVPNPGYAGGDLMSYEICDDDGACVITDVNIVISSGNINPVANNDFASTPANNPVTVDVLANDSDADGTLVTGSLTIVTAPANGTATPDLVSGEITYDPATGYMGLDTVWYEICDNGSPAACGQAYLVVTVNDGSVTIPPVTINDTVATLEDVSVAIDVVANDLEGQNTIDTTSVTIVDGPYNGTASVDPVTGVVTYTPDPDFEGSDWLTYRLCDVIGACATANAFITVTAVPDAPTAWDDNAGTVEEVPVDINLVFNDVDPEDALDPCTINIYDAPNNGTASLNPVTCLVTYTPAPNFEGLDTFYYEICDGGGLCDSARVLVLVAPDNDSPDIVDDAATTPVSTAVVIDVLTNDSDPDGTLIPATTSVIVPPMNGTVSVDGTTGDITYTPTGAFTGTDYFQYEVCDDNALCNRATVLVTVGGGPAPIAVDDSELAIEDAMLTIDILGNDVIFLGPLDPTTISLISSPMNGSVTFDATTGEAYYTPAPDYFGTDEFTYFVCDIMGFCDQAVVDINIAGVPDEPTSANDVGVTLEDVPVAVNILANDYDPDSDLNLTTVSLVTPPSNGAVYTDPVSGEVVYTPNPGFFGVDTFWYRVCDLNSFCDTARVIIIIQEDPNLPQLVDDYATTFEPFAVAVDVIANDITGDYAFDFSTLAVATAPTQGTAVVDVVAGTITYTPNAGYCDDSDSLVYSLCDNGGYCGTAWVRIDIGCSPPEAEDDFVTTTPGIAEPIAVLDNDWEGSASIDISSLAITGGATQGTTVIDAGTGVITWTPNDSEWFGMDSFEYNVCNNLGLCDDAMVYINSVLFVVEDETTITPFNTPVDISILDNDDATADPNCITVTSNPSNGWVTINTDGTVTYNPNLDFEGVDCFSYQVCDNTGTFFGEAIVCIDVQPGPPDLHVPNVLTPNGDGFNDVFEIVGLEQYPDHQLMIFNRYEVDVFAATDYQNNWDGKWQKNGNELPDGTYYYVLELDRNNPDAKIVSGFIQLHR